MERVLCGNREELYQFLDTLDWKSKQETELSSVYLLIKYKNNIEPIYFMNYNSLYLESPCFLHSCSMTEEELKEYVKSIYSEDSFEKALNFEKTMYINGIHYEIDCPQVSPFLKENIEIIDILSETECINWILENSDGN